MLTNEIEERQVTYQNEINDLHEKLNEQKSICEKLTSELNQSKEENDSAIKKNAELLEMIEKVDSERTETQMKLGKAQEEFKRN